jgi:hypothetical protein
MHLFVKESKVDSVASSKFQGSLSLITEKCPGSCKFMLADWRWPPKSSTLIGLELIMCIYRCIAWVSKAIMNIYPGPQRILGTSIIKHKWGC